MYAINYRLLYVFVCHFVHSFFYVTLTFGSIQWTVATTTTTSPKTSQMRGINVESLWLQTKTRLQIYECIELMVCVCVCSFSVVCQFIDRTTRNKTYIGIRFIKCRHVSQYKRIKWQTIPSNTKRTIETNIHKHRGRTEQRSREREKEKKIKQK